MISETVTVLGSSLVVSRIEKATVESLCWGCADRWHAVGSIDLKLHAKSASLLPARISVKPGILLLAKEVSEVCDGVLRIADELCLRLGAMIFLSLNVGKDRGDLAI